MKNMREEVGMSPALMELIERARKAQMTDQQHAEQRISFAYGNTRIENNDITRETVLRAAETLKTR